MKHFITAILLLASTQAQAFDLPRCLANNSKADCSRQMMIEEELSKPLTPGEEIAGASGKYTVTIQGENWLQNGWSGQPEQMKDLGLIKGDGVGILNFETGNIQEVDFETTITEDMKGIYAGMQAGFSKGKIDITKQSEMELLPLTISGGNGMLRRFCYHINVKIGKTVCVYEGLIGRGNGESIKLLGSIGDYDNMRAEMESIITSFKFKE